MMKRIIGITVLLLTIVQVGSALAARQFISHKVDVAPVLDGKGVEAVWNEIKPDVIHDKTAEVNFFLKSVHTDDQIFFCVQYKDAAENAFHKPWLWDKAESKYTEGAHREDTFVFKWNMTNHEVDLSNFSDDSYTADVWYWKANRTNLAGYADDKIHILSDTPGDEATETVSASGKKRYLYRKSDSGKQAYKELKTPPAEFKTPLVNRFEPTPPQGSRGDVRARGAWEAGYWTIEFARDHKTGNDDDVQFAPGSDTSYLFGVSIYSLYGRPLVMDQPNRYGMGRISDPLELVFEKQGR